MRAILIDPAAQTVTQTDCPCEGEDGYKEIQKAIGARLFSVIYLPPDHSLFIDDEGLYAEDLKYFSVGDYPQPLVGKGLILGWDKETGDSLPATIALETVQAKVGWPNVRLAGFRDARGRAVVEGLGPAFVIDNRAIFDPADE